MTNICDQLIAELDEARVLLFGLVRDLDPQIEVYPGWTVKELLAHVTGWDDLVIATLEAFLAGQPVPLAALQGVDPYNASTVSERGSLPLSVIRNEYETTREQLKAIIRSVPAERFSEVINLPWGERSSVSDMIRIFSHHEIEHQKEIMAHLNA